MAIQHTDSSHTVIRNRPLEDWPLTELVEEIEADYNSGQQVRFEVLSELIFRAGAAEPVSQ